MYQLNPNFKVQYTSNLIEGIQVNAVIIFKNRVYQASLDLRGRFFIESDDELPIPLFVMHESYRQMHYTALSWREGKEPSSDQPDLQISRPIKKSDNEDDKFTTVGKEIVDNFNGRRLTPPNNPVES